ncbi:hypothetical protein [Glacieibacterium sp.]|uniref:hypothetical protein n=1 Tax=Glacieibacterium sp. TaxID=2860237 RepID=UPI003AFFF2D2
MRILLELTIVVIALLASPLAARPVPLVTIPLPAIGQPLTRITIKDAVLTARLALGFDNALLLNLGPATAAKLRAFPLIGKQTVRNPLIPGGEAVARGNIYSVGVAGLPAHSVPTVWIDKAIATDADGIVSALSIDADRVVFSRGGPATGKVYTLTRKGTGDASVRAVIAGVEVTVGLDLASADTIMSLGAAAAMQGASVVKRSGRVGLWTPFPGVRLPFERLSPVPNARFLDMPLIAPTGRITEAEMKRLDTRAAAGTSTADDDADAITVTATVKKNRRGIPWVLIGRDVLDHCSRIELDRPGKRWLLTCDF